MNILKNLITLIFFIFTFIPYLYSQELLIQPGDAIEISVFGNEELNKTVIVKQNGTIDYPAIQGLPVDGITIERFQEILVSQLSRYMEQTPLITVKFAEEYPIRITVLGQVQNPGIITIQNTSSIQGAIFAAGGFAPGAQLANVKLIRIKEGDTKNQLINLDDFYKKGDLAVLPAIKNGDTIVVPGNPMATTVKVLGCIKNPGSYEIFSMTSILDMIYLAGGPAENADLNNVLIASVITNKVRYIEINVKEFMKSNSIQSIPEVFPGDIIYVSEKKITWRKFVTFLRDITSVAMLYYFMRRVDRY